MFWVYMLYLLHVIKSWFGEKNLKSSSSSEHKEIKEAEKQIQTRKGDN